MQAAQRRRPTGSPRPTAERPRRTAIRAPRAGHDTSNVDASTTAYQTNFLAADMSQNVAAGIGGNGGSGNKAEGGDVHIKASIESVNLNDVLNHSGGFHGDDFVHV